MGKVTALFKSCSRLDTNNSRPVTLLPTLSKILKKAVHSQVYGFFKTNKLLIPSQFGIREICLPLLLLQDLRILFRLHR